MKSYWLRCASSAMTTMLRRSESTGCRSPFSSGKNFWIVVKTTPPEATASFARRSARSAACTGGWRSRSRQRAKVPKSWSSRSLRSVSTTIVGFAIAGCEDHAPGVEGHRQALARALRVPDDADAPVARLAARPLARLVPARRLGDAVARRAACAARSVSSTAAFTAWNWW